MNACQNEEGPAEVFLEEEYDVRYPVVILLVIVVGIAGLFLLGALVRTILTGDILSFGCLAETLGLLVTGSFAIWMGWGLVFNPVSQTRIDSFGVTTGGLTYPWEIVDTIYNQSQAWDRVGVRFLLRSRGPSKPIRNLFVKPMMPADYEALAEQLELWLKDHHPHVHVG